MPTGAAKNGDFSRNEFSRTEVPRRANADLNVNLATAAGDGAQTTARAESYIFGQAPTIAS